MKRFTLMMLALLAMSLQALAQEEPSFTFHQEPTGEERYISIAFSEGVSKKIRVDWGDGNVVESTETVGNEPVSVHGTVVGSGMVKVYGADDAVYLDVESDYTNYIDAVDVNKLTQLRSLRLTANTIVQLDLTHNVALKELYYDGCGATSVDLSKNVNLTTLNLNDNDFDTVDLSNNTLLENLEVSGGKLVSLDITPLDRLNKLIINDAPKFTTLTFDATNSALNDLTISSTAMTVFDGSVLTGFEGGTIKMKRNKLTTFVKPAGKLAKLDLSYNTYTFNTLPGFTATEVDEYVYAPQVIPTPKLVSKTLDLSAYASAVDADGKTRPSTFSVMSLDEESYDYKNLEPDVDFTYNNGVITFLRELQYAKVYVYNPAFPQTADARFETNDFNVTLETPSFSFVTQGAESFTNQAVFSFTFDTPHEIRIDMGDGNVETIAADGLEFLGRAIKGDYINVYGADDVAVIDATVSRNKPLVGVDVTRLAGLRKLVLTGNEIATIDLSQNVALQDVRLNNCLITTLDLTNNTQLTTLDVSNTRLEGLDAIKGLSALTQLTTLTASGIQTKSVDLTAFHALQSFTMRNAGLENIVFSSEANPELYKLYLTNNNLTSLDLSAMPSFAKAKSYVDVSNNKLESFKSIAEGKIATLRISGNNLKFSTLPPLSVATSYTYAPQNPVVVPLEVARVLDLSSEASVAGAEGPVATRFVVTGKDNVNLKLDEDYTIENGVIKFINIPADSVYVRMNNDAFPKINGTTTRPSSLNTILFKVVDDKPALPPLAVVLTAEGVDTQDRTIKLSFAMAEKQVYIDWGDGVPVLSNETVGGFATAVVGRVKGSQVKIYDSELDGIDITTTGNEGAVFTAIDVTGMDNLNSLTASNNKLSSLDISKFSRVNTLVLDNNQFKTIDLSAQVNLRTLKLSGNPLENFDLSGILTKNVQLATLYINDVNIGGKADFSKMTYLRDLQMMNAGLEEATFGFASKNTTLTKINLSGNKLTTIDLSMLAMKRGVLNLEGNNLTELVKPSDNLNTVNVKNNKFTFLTLPVFKQNAGLVNETGYTYAPQQPMQVAESVEASIDLSNMASVTGLGESATPTVFTVATEDGTALVEGTDFSVENGVISFLTKQDKKLVVTLTNEAAFKDFNSEAPFVTTPFSVSATLGIQDLQINDLGNQPVYNLSGVRVQPIGNRLPKGIYIIGGKKVVVR